ncbi:unnamed protein product, partial [Brenthis ino]
MHLGTKCGTHRQSHMYACTSGGPGFESRVGTSLVMEFLRLVSLSNSPEMGSWRCFTPVPRRARKAVGPVPQLSTPLEYE